MFLYHGRKAPCITRFATKCNSKCHCPTRKHAHTPPPLAQLILCDTTILCAPRPSPPPFPPASHRQDGPCPCPTECGRCWCATHMPPLYFAVPHVRQHYPIPQPTCSPRPRFDTAHSQHSGCPPFTLTLPARSPPPHPTSTYRSARSQQCCPARQFFRKALASSHGLHLGAEPFSRIFASLGMPERIVRKAIQGGFARHAVRLVQNNKRLCDLGGGHCKFCLRERVRPEKATHCCLCYCLLDTFRLGAFNVNFERLSRSTGVA